MAREGWRLLLAVGLAGCGGSEEGDATPRAAVELRGAVHKGPFVLGSSVTLSAVDENGVLTGQQYSTSTTTDSGEFSVSLDYRGRVALEASGFYYNEVTGALATGNLTLRAFAEVSGSGAQQAYINLITHLVSERVKRLLAGELDLPAAVEQAERELHAAIGLEIAPEKSGIAMNLLGGG